MENGLQPTEWNADQRRIAVDTAQLHEAYMDAFLKSRAYRGGMHWKKAKGKEYLFRSLDRRGYGRSLGPRSGEAEQLHLEFHENKKQLGDRLNALGARLKEQARFCKAARIARVPRIVTAICRLLEQHQIMGRNLQVIGTNALYAYEARAGVFFESGLLATRDLDVLWGVHAKLRLFATDEADTKGLIDILRKADRSFHLQGRRSFRAINQDGYRVDLVKPEPRSMRRKEKRTMGGEDDLADAEVKNLQWLVAAPRFSQIVIGDDGFPAAMVVPDPRAFAIHKLWLSAQKDREPVKKERDRHQGVAVCRLVLRYLPQLSFKPEELRIFPKDLLATALEDLNHQALPSGF